MIGLNVVVLSHVFGSFVENTAAVAGDAVDLLNYSVAVLVVYYKLKSSSSM